MRKIQKQRWSAAYVRRRHLQIPHIQSWRGDGDGGSIYGLPQYYTLEPVALLTTSGEMSWSLDFALIRRRKRRTAELGQNVISQRPGIYGRVVVEIGGFGSNVADGEGPEGNARTAKDIRLDNIRVFHEHLEIAIATCTASMED